MARKNMTDYPTVMGDKRVSCIVHNGPASYAVIVQNAAGPTGGDVVTAAELGLKAIDWAQCMGGDNGQHDAVVFSANANPLSSFGGQPCTSLRLMWQVAATGAEAAGAANLSARSVRILAFGPK